MNQITTSIYDRLTPLMALMMWISASLAVYMANGPFWMQNGYDPMCAKNWWTNVLYVNNLVDTTHAVSQD